MDALKNDDQREFVTRQYATLVAGGMDTQAARARLEDVLGKPAMAYLDTHGDQAAKPGAGESTTTVRLMDATSELGGNTAGTQAAFIQSLAEARLFASDWWRPVRTFLLYIVFLLALAVLVAIIYTIWVLPAFSQLDQTLTMNGGAASWVMAKGAIRLFAPLAAMVILLALLAVLWRRMRFRMTQLAPLGTSGISSLHGRSGTAYQVLLCLEYAAALKEGGIADAAVLDPALRLAQWPSGKPFQFKESTLGEELEQAERLGTFAAELEWQRRVHWSRAQSQLELSRDQLILLSRIVFYILIGIMVTVLYVPIFSVATMFGVH